MRKVYARIIKITGLIFILCLWQLISSLNILEPSLFPTPTESFSTLLNLLLCNDLLKEILYTFQRVITGFSFATVLGILFGLIVGGNRILDKSLEGVIDFFRSIPVITLYPIFIMLFGINDEVKIAMTFWATFWIVSLNTVYGVKQSIKVRRDVAKVYGASRIQSFRWITFYEALPQIFIGMRIAISYALLAEIMCEMFMGSNFGIGQKIYESNVKLSMPELFALVAITGLLGIFVNRIFVVLEKRIIPWAGKL